MIFKGSREIQPAQAGEPLFRAGGMSALLEVTAPPHFTRTNLRKVFYSGKPFLQFTMKTKSTVKVQWLFALQFVVLLAGLGGASGIGGIEGISTFDYSGWNNMSFDDWPQDYKDLCLKHMRAVIKKCSQLGYDNWSVNRDFSGRVFSPSDGKFGSSDWVIGANTCDDGANAIDEARVFSASLSLMCSENNFCGNIRSDQYFCQFSCHAYNCDKDDDPFEVYACSVTKEPDTSRDAFGQITQGCREQAVEACSARGDGCELERPCYFKNKFGDRADDVFCKCTCPYKPFEKTITDGQLSEAEAETFDIDSFDFMQWGKQHKSPCWGKTSVADETKKGRNILSRVAGGIKGAFGSIGRFFGSAGSKVAGLIGRSRLPFSANAGAMATGGRDKAPVNERIRAMLMDETLCEPDATGTGGGDSGPKPADFVIIGSQAGDAVSNSQEIIEIAATGVVDVPPKPQVSTATQITVPVPKCVEDWSCMEWGSWSDYSRCDPAKQNDTQLRSRARKCADKNSCNTFEKKPKTSESETKPCGAAPASSDTNGACAESWSCAEWGAWGTCSSGSQSRSRTCADARSCGTISSRPQLSESRSCSDTVVACTQSWSCGEFGQWGEWGACQLGGSQSRSRARQCTDANNCGATSSRPTLDETQSQSCTYVPPKEYHEKESYLGMVALGASAISVGQTLSPEIGPGQSVVYVLDMAPGKAYKIKVAAGGAGGLALTYQQRYGPPQVTYADGPAGSGETTISGGPGTSAYGDQQKMAIRLGPAQESLTAQITVSEAG